MLFKNFFCIDAAPWVVAAKSLDPNHLMKKGGNNFLINRDNSYKNCCHTNICLFLKNSFISPQSSSCRLSIIPFSRKKSMSYPGDIFSRCSSMQERKTLRILFLTTALLSTVFLTTKAHLFTERLFLAYFIPKRGVRINCV